MNEYKLSDLNNLNKTVHVQLRDLGAFKGVDKHKSLKQLTFYEFTLEELGFPSADKILNGVKNIENEIGLQGWRTKDYEAKTYKGFSLTHNPDFFDSSASIHHQTWGHKLMTQTYSGRVNIGEHQQERNTYYDTYAFRHIDDVVHENLKGVIDNLSMSLLRSRCAYLIPNDHKDPFKSAWHTDEAPVELLRINIPLQTCKGHELHIKGEDIYGNSYETKKHLEVGKVYLWNTGIPHTIGAHKGTDKSIERIHLVLGVCPYFDYNKEKDSFIQNKFFGQNLHEIITNKLFVKNGL